MGIIVGATVVYSYNELISIRSMKGAGSMPRKLIMCGNHPVLAFEYDPESGHACIDEVPGTKPLLTGDMTLSLGEATSGHPLFKPSHSIQHIN